MLLEINRPGHPLSETPCEGARLNEEYLDKLAESDVTAELEPKWVLEVDCPQIEALLEQFGLVTIAAHRPSEGGVITLGPPY